MKKAVDEAFEGLINFIANPKPDQETRDKALRGLVELRDWVNLECGE